MSKPPSQLRRALVVALAFGAILALFALKVWHADEASGRRVGFSLTDTNRGVVIGEVLPD